MVRPIDMNQGVMQSHATEKIQKVQQQHPDMQQRYFSMQLHEEKRRQNEKISDAEETKKKTIDARQEKNNEQNKRESEQMPGQTDDDRDADSILNAEQGFHHIDIKA